MWLHNDKIAMQQHNECAPTQYFTNECMDLEYGLHVSSEYHELLFSHNTMYL